MMRRNAILFGTSIRSLFIFLGVGACALTAGSVALADAPRARASTVEMTYALQATSEVTPTADPACPLTLVIVGSGHADLLGVIHDEQSHCLRNDGTFDGGIFTFTAAVLDASPGGADAADTVVGKYRGRLVPALPTSKSVFTNPPGGYWLIYGEVCIWKGTGRFAGIVNDCPAPGSAGHFFPARGTTDLDTGQANIFGSAIVIIRD